jgi:uncharacterized membrane protein
MSKYLIAYAGTTVVFFAIDMIWLSVIARNFYRNALGDMLLEQPNMMAAALFYSVFIVGIVIFCVAPALTAQSWLRALSLGALFGFFTYATYDMTNLATLKGWPVRVVIVDIIWGTVLTGLSAAAGYGAVSAFTR